MYITNFACTYKLHDEEDQEDVYRAQFLQAFNLNEWDDNKINEETDKQAVIARGKLLDFQTNTKNNVHSEKIEIVKK